MPARLPNGYPILGATSAAFSSFAPSAIGLSRPMALAAYRELFRTGRTESLDFEPPRAAAVFSEECDEGTTLKFLSRVPGAERAGERGPELEVESVLIPMIGRTGRRTYTLCVSSQVGCAMGCTFCETGQMGLLRSLSPAEIVTQWFIAVHELKRRVSNLVFMGMGEPMDNLDAVLDAVAVLTDHNGAAMPMSKVTISTVGRVDGVRRLAAKVLEPGWRRLNLALSLNAARDALRSEIMPVNRRWGLEELRRAFLGFPRFGGGKLMFEYVLIPGVNDAEEDAAAIADFVRPFRLPDGRHRVCLNLIPYNPRRNSPWPAPDEARIQEFLAWLLSRDVYAKRRRTKGRTMMGACGQLGSERIRARRFVELGGR